MQEPELYCRNYCNKINSVNGCADFAAIYTELKHMCLGDLGSKHLQTVYILFHVFIMVLFYLFWLGGICFCTDPQVF